MSCYFAKPRSKTGGKAFLLQVWQLLALPRNHVWPTQITGQARFKISEDVWRRQHQNPWGDGISFTPTTHVADNNWGQTDVGGAAKSPSWDTSAAVEAAFIEIS